MPAAGLLVAVHQDLFVGLEEEHAHLEAVGLEAVEHLEQFIEVFAAANVGDDRGPLDAAAGEPEHLAEGTDHLRRQVVDTEIAVVLEGGDRLGLAGTGMPGDHDHLDLLLAGF